MTSPMPSTSVSDLNNATNLTTTDFTGNTIILIPPDIAIYRKHLSSNKWRAIDIDDNGDDCHVNINSCPLHSLHFEVGYFSI